MIEIIDKREKATKPMTFGDLKIGEHFEWADQERDNRLRRKVDCLSYWREDVFSSLINIDTHCISPTRPVRRLDVEVTIRIKGEAK